MKIRENRQISENMHKAILKGRGKRNRCATLLLKRFLLFVSLGVVLSAEAGYWRDHSEVGYWADWDTSIRQGVMKQHHVSASELGKCIQDYSHADGSIHGYCIYLPNGNDLAGWQKWLECMPGLNWSDVPTKSCKPPYKSTGKQQCAGNPIIISNGSKFQHEVDTKATSVSADLAFDRYYNSAPTQSDVGLGLRWRHTYSRSVVQADTSAYIVYRPDGRAYTFQLVGQDLVSDPDVVVGLERVLDGDGDLLGYKLHTVDDSEETYSSSGKLTSIVNRVGITTTLFYDLDSNSGGDDDPETLDRVENSLGKFLTFVYESSLSFNRISQIVDPDGKLYQYKYKSNNVLESVIYPDDTPDNQADNSRKVYHYENETFPYLLTGITDENGVRYATWSYDGQGRAISSEHANGIDKVTLDYTYLEDATDPRVAVTNPLGKQTTYHFTTIHGVRKVTQVDGHPTASCEGANKTYSYDANGNVISKTDWNGVTTTYTYDMDRNLELSRTKAAGTPQERTITTEWHPDFRLPTKITEPNKITEYTYDGQGRQLTRKVSSNQ